MYQAAVPGSTDCEASLTVMPINLKIHLGVKDFNRHFKECSRYWAVLGRWGGAPWVIWQYGVRRSVAVRPVIWWSVFARRRTQWYVGCAGG